MEFIEKLVAESKTQEPHPTNDAGERYIRFCHALRETVHTPIKLTLGHIIGIAAIFGLSEQVKDILSDELKDVPPSSTEPKSFAAPTSTDVNPEPGTSEPHATSTSTSSFNDHVERVASEILSNEWHGPVRLVLQANAKIDNLVRYGVANGLSGDEVLVCYELTGESLHTFSRDSGNVLESPGGVMGGWQIHPYDMYRFNRRAARTEAERRLQSLEATSSTMSSPPDAT